MGKCVWDRDVWEVIDLPKTRLEKDIWSLERQIPRIPESLIYSTETRVELQGERAFHVPPQ